jgi:sortase (surface protein transpeptidase)
MVTLFVRHAVADYDIWKQGYDDAKSLQKEHGVLAESVYRDADDDSVVIVTHKFQDVESARAFINLDELKSGMQEAGVQGQPTFWFGEEIA